MRSLILILCTQLLGCLYGQAATLNSFTGQWTCYKFEKSTYPLDKRFIWNVSGLFNENFATEFARYSYFDIEKEGESTYSISVVDKFRTSPLHIMNIQFDSTLSEQHESNLANFLLKHANSIEGCFMKPEYKYAYYVDSLSSINIELPVYISMPFSELIYVTNNNEIVVPYKGFLFFYRKQKYINSAYNIDGIPGDMYNYFTVKKLFSTTSIDNAYKKFLTDFPFAAECCPKNVPINRYTNYEGGCDVMIDRVNKDVLNIKSMNSMGMFQIEFKQIGTDVHMTYEFIDFDYDTGSDS